MILNSIKSIAVIFLFMAVVLSAGEDFTIVSNGKGVASILLPENADRELTEHVEYFNSELSKSTGFKLPLLKNENIKGRKIIFSVSKVDFIHRSRYVIDFPDISTMRISGTPLAIRYALNSIVERAGICYPFPGKSGAYYPKCSNLSVPVKKMEKDAAFRIFRSIFSMDDEWQTNLNCKLMDSYELVNHGVDRIFPIAKYSKGEWIDKIMPYRNGTREKDPKRHLWEPCYSNPATVEEAIKNISMYFDKHPEQDCYSLVVNDGYNYYCSCPACEKANEGEKITSLEPNLHNRSEVYYEWVNNVARKLGKTYPQKILGVLAYNNVKNPPSFKIEPNVVVTIACEAYALSDPEMKVKLQELYNAWAERAAHLGIWEYGYGIAHYTLPRVFFKYQVEQIRWFAKNKGEVGFVEAMPSFGQGPHLYLYLKLFYDPETDVEKTLDKWYVATVGKQAAPALKEYYEFWNSFWDGPVKKSNWYNTTKHNVYFGLMPDGNYHFAVKKGDAEYCRKLMEEVVTKAERHGDSGQKERAMFLMKEFEFYEASMLMNGNGLPAINGTLPNKECALELARSLPEIMKATIKRKVVTEYMLANFPKWWGGIYSYPAGIKRRYDKLKMPEVVFGVIPYLHEKDVFDAYEKSLKTPEIPEEWRKILHSFLRTGKNETTNLLEDGSFESDGEKYWTPRPKSTDQYAASGKKSCEVTLPADSVRLTRNFANHSGNTYFLLAKILVPADYPPGQVKASCIIIGRNNNNHSTNYYIPVKFDVTPGKWTLIYTIATPGIKAIMGEAIIRIEGMKRGDKVFVDDVVLMEFDDEEKPAESLSKQPEGAFSGWVISDIEMRKESTQYVKVETDKVTLAAKEKPFSYFSPKPVPVKNADEVKISFNVSGKGSAGFGFFAYEGSGWKQVNGHVIQPLTLKNEPETVSVVLPVNGKGIGSVRPVFNLGKESEITISNYQLTVEK